MRLSLERVIGLCAATKSAVITDDDLMEIRMIELRDAEFDELIKMITGIGELPDYSQLQIKLEAA